MNSGAEFSECRTYRYKLWRIWDEKKPLVLFIGLNPSTADETKNDPTIRRCIGFAQDWGFGGVVVTNLFAFRATKPADLFRAAEPVGPKTDQWLKRLSGESELVVAAWGNDGAKFGRSDEIRMIIPKMKCLNLNKSGEPAHPLYQKKDTKPVDF